MIDDQTLAERIRQLAPRLNDSDWADVVRRSKRERASQTPQSVPRRAPRMPLGRRRLLAVALTAAVIAAAAALVPGRLGSNHETSSILSSALAAVSTGPVLHVVLQTDTAQTIGGSPGTRQQFFVVDLHTGRETVVETKTEIWYDPARHYRHEQISVGGGLTFNGLETPTSSLTNITRPGPGTTPTFDPGLLAFFTGYKQALQEREATIAGTTVIDGHAVEWLRFRVALSFHAHTEVAHEEVAVDRDSFRPLFLRSVCQVCTTPPPTYRIIALEGISRTAANFSKPVHKTYPSGRYANAENRIIEPRQASTLLQHTAYWVGPSIGPIRFSAVMFNNYTRHSGAPVTKHNLIARGLGLTIYYGAQVRANGGIRPIPGRPGMSIRETANYIDGPGNFNNRQAGRPLTIAGAPIPPPGQIALNSFGQGRWDGQLRKDGLYIEINAPSRQLVIATARALTQIP